MPAAETRADFPGVQSKPAFTIAQSRATILRMNHGAPFTAQEDEYLVENFREKETAELAAKLKRTISSTQNRLRHLNLRKRPSDKPLQEKFSIFLDVDLIKPIASFQARDGLSFSAKVQELVKIGLRRQK